MEALVRGAYPMMAEDTIDMLAKDCFVDGFEDRQLQIHVKQVAPRNVQEALARTAEFQAFLMTAATSPSPFYTGHATKMTGRPCYVRARQVQTNNSPQPSK